MKRMTMALLAAAGVAAAAGSARADWGGLFHRSAPAAPPGGGEFTSPDTLSGVVSARPAKNPDRYGLLPGLRKVFQLGGKDQCDACGGKHGRGKGGCPAGNCGPFGRGGHGDPAGGHGYGPYGAAGYPQMMQGTLVFPHHPFVRSPRDFFMVDPVR